MRLALLTEAVALLESRVAAAMVGAVQLPPALVLMLELATLAEQQAAGPPGAVAQGLTSRCKSHRRGCLRRHQTLLLRFPRQHQPRALQPRPSKRASRRTARPICRSIPSFWAARGGKGQKGDVDEVKRVSHVSPSHVVVEGNVLGRHCMLVETLGVIHLAALAIPIQLLHWWLLSSRLTGILRGGGNIGLAQVPLMPLARSYCFGLARERRGVYSYQGRGEVND